MPAKPKSKSKSVDPIEVVEVEGENEKEDVETEENGVEAGVDEEEDEDEDDEEGEYEVEALLDHEMVNGQYRYLVSWKNYGPEHNTWEPEAHVNHATEMITKYWANKPKNATKPMAASSSKPGRGAGTTSRRGGNAPRTNGTTRGRRGAVTEEDEEEEEGPDFGDTHVDSLEKYKDVGDWEELVQSIDTIERTAGDGDNEGMLMIYLTMTGGEKVAQPVDMAYRRCPQKVLKFYEKHLKWRV